MREIKFRAWDEVAGRMESNFDLRVRDGGIHIMQFTGLKDKNGTEIYEGDIVKNHRGEYQNLFVQWDYNGYGLFDRIDGLEVREDTLSDEFEVIGNIYQNSDLLK